MVIQESIAQSSAALEQILGPNQGGKDARISNLTEINQEYVDLYKRTL